MVFRIASTGFETLDLNNFADNFGADDDVLVITDSYGSTGNVATYGGNDVIVLNNFSSGYSGPIWSGLGNDTIIGGAGIEVVTGGDGNDVISTGGGNDEIFNDRGNDTLIGGDGADIIHFTAYGANGPGQGIANNTSITCDLAINSAQNFGVFGTDTLVGIENIFGGGGNDRFFGTSGANGIEGRGAMTSWMGEAGTIRSMASTAPIQ